MESTAKEHELNQMLRFEQIKELSSEEDEDILARCTFPNHPETNPSRASYRKPLKNAYSDDSSSESSLEPGKGVVLLPPKPAKTKSVLQQAQE